MRITQTIAILLLSLFIPAGIAAQSVLKEPLSLQLEDEPIGEALFRLSERSDVNITFSPNFFKPNQKVSIAAYNEPLEEVLKRFFSADQYWFFDYLMEELYSTGKRNFAILLVVI